MKKFVINASLCICFLIIIFSYPHHTIGELDKMGNPRLTIDRFENGKPYFKLNNKSFLPIITYCSPNVEEMKSLKNRGFNMLYVAIDYPWVESTDEAKKIRDFLETATQINIPIIIELQEWDYWKNWLKKNRECNMVLANGDYVDTYPDYTNPDAEKEHLRRFQTIVEFLKPYFNQPIVAFSLGAYDAYHIPDGEIHVDFVTPPLTKLEQTFLPFGQYSLTAYKNFLQVRGISLKEIGFNSESEIYLPTEKEKAKTYFHWVSWIHYRRYYTYCWLKKTAELVQKLSGLPVTVTYDIKFALAERWGTPLLEEAELFDFLMVYYYEFDNLELIPQRYIAISEYYLKKGIPFIDMFDVPPPKDDVEKWIESVTPFVSGYLLLPSPEMRRDIQAGKDFYALFLKAVEEANRTGSWKKRATIGELAILLSQQDIYVTDRLYEILRGPIFLRIPYKIIYDVEVKESPKIVNEFKAIYIPKQQPMMKADKDMIKTLSDFKTLPGHYIVEEESGYEQSVKQLAKVFGSSKKQ